MSLARGGNNYPIHARDISHKAEVSETWTQFGAEQACRRLSVTFEAVANQQDAVRAVIEQRADAEREAIWARQARAEQQVSPKSADRGERASCFDPSCLLLAVAAAFGCEAERKRLSRERQCSLVERCPSSSFGPSSLVSV